ncbi:hypothetical protein DRQ11_05795 [candidate division KSB1 bacterium]|nr:MAG: hypothetical protein DRQ11_05795 [candidate division KSB1 bacterium]
MGGFVFGYTYIFNNLGSFAEVITGVLGIAITVVAIVVELAATRYTPKITDLFIKEKINLIVLPFYIFLCIVSIWIAGFQGAKELSAVRAIVLVYLGFVSVSFLTIIPYFYYIFRFLRPQNIISKLENQVIRILESSLNSNTNIATHKAQLFTTIEQISDIGINSISSLDRSLGLASIDSLKNILLYYFRLKDRLPAGWFTINEDNFLGFSKISTRKIEADHTWVEMAVLKQFEFIFSKAVKTIREMVQEISNTTKEIALVAIRARRQETAQLLVIYFNTFLRISLNEKDQYAAYNLFDQYRLLAEETMTIDPNLTLEIANYFKYYGQLALNLQLPFILETAAHDLRVLNEKAYQVGFSAISELLEVFLRVDKPPGSRFEEVALRGVRKSQAILASFYLLHNEETLARRIYDDMKLEPWERLCSIRDEILNVEKERFWEVTDRWVNFDYVDPKRKEKLKEFFTWFKS